MYNKEEAYRKFLEENPEYKSIPFWQLKLRGHCNKSFQEIGDIYDEMDEILTNTLAEYLKRKAP